MNNNMDKGTGYVRGYIEAKTGADIKEIYHVKSCGEFEIIAKDLNMTDNIIDALRKDFKINDVKGHNYEHHKEFDGAALHILLEPRADIQEWLYTY